MYSLCDVNACYVSCERAWQPSLREKPSVVLSNNDGALVAVCRQVKEAGVPKFAPYFKVKDQLDAIGAQVRSSNYELYADMSMRMMNTLRDFAPNFHAYSIDEAFLHYQGYVPPEGWFEHARKVRRKVWDEVRLPIGVGIGPTPTLAKAANHAAKRIAGYRGIAVIEDDDTRRYILSKMSVSDVWGIGSRLTKRLNAIGISDALTLSVQSPSMIRKMFSRPVEDTVRELAGEVRLSWDEVRAPKKEIFSTRSMGTRIEDFNTLREALCSHAEIVSAKLRRQHSVASGMVIFASNSPYDKDQYFRRSTFYQFTIPTCDTRKMCNAITESMSEIYRSGVRYYRCGIGLVGINTSQVRQADMFQPETDNLALMSTMDRINAKYGRGTVHLAAKGFDQKFAMRREFLSPQFTTRWSDIPRIIC